MKNKHIFKLLCLVFFSSIAAFGQQNKELKCFDNFQYNNSNNSRVNAYLLAMVNHYMYPHILLGVEDNTSAAIALSQSNDEFETEFKAKMTPWFLTNRATMNNPTISLNKLKEGISKKMKKSVASNSANAPVIEFIHESNGSGYDPEVMLISTDNYIVLAWRGTDRVSSTTPLIGGAIFKVGEWLQTNLDFPLVNTPSGVRGRVHRGFTSSLTYNNMLGRVANRLTELNVANKKLWVTGHSLGGAHAKLSALYLKKLHNIQPFAVYTYGAPGVGDQRLNNEIESVLPGSKLQQFRYLHDPVTRVPSSRIPGMSDYTRAGQMNYYSSEQGSNNYFYNKAYEPQFPSPFLCHHHSHWYARAAFFELVDKKPTLANTLPNAPSMPTQGCTALDTQMANGNGGIVQSFFGIDQDIEDGNYYIINAKSGKYLTLDQNDVFENGKPIRLRNFRSDRRFKWKIESIPHSPLGGNIIINKKGNKLIDADRSGVGEQNSMVQTWKRLSVLIPIRTHQEWEIERLNNGSFHIKNLKNRQFKLRSTSSNRVILDDNSGLSSQWHFVKITN